MKRNSSSKSGFINTRNLLGVFLCLFGISLAMLSFAEPLTSQQPAVQKSTAKAPTKVRTVQPLSPTVLTAPTPAGGTLTRTNTGSANALNWSDPVGSALNLTFFAGSGTCQVPQSCSTFALHIDSTVGTPVTGGYDPTKYEIFIELSWPQAAVDYDTWICSGAGNCVQANVVGSNTSTADPETITFPTTLAAGDYTINAVNTTGAPVPYTGTVYLRPIPMITGCTGNCTPPRYQNYAAGPNQSNNAGEPSLGVDWNPNVATLQDTTSHTLTTGFTRLNTGGVAFFTSGPNEWRSNFNDCASPAYNSRALSQTDNPPPYVNNWDDVSATTTQQFVLSDPIGFVDHYTSNPLGLVYPPPHTPGRVFTIDLLGGQGDSAGSYSDVDGNSYLPPNGGAGGTGGPGQGPDHETLGGGPYNPNSIPPPPPQPSPYPAVGTPNAIYYCSQNIVGEAQCSRSDAGGQAGTFGPGVPIYNPTQCTGGIHGHVKVAPDGTVYVPNSSCGVPAGNSGVAVSTDNGLTWTENNVTGSVNGSQDPSVGIGQNNVGKVGTTNTIYLGYINGGHPYIAYSHDRGLTWDNLTGGRDVGSDFGITHAVFPVVVAGDDNRAAFAFLGTGDGILAPGATGTCDPYGATLNCANIWHLYIATTYDGGANWVTIDATPNDPVQKGTICLQGTTCAGGRNLLDFNDFTVDAEGRGLVGYADGCVDCGNSFDTQSSANHGTIARQSGGRRLFAHFDPVEPMPPASPQLISAVTQANGNLVTWLEPDNGGSPITGYNVWRSTTSGNEAFVAHVSGETNTTYFDATPPAGNAFYFVEATNNIGSGGHCGEVSLSAGGVIETECVPPGLTKLTDPAGDTTVCSFASGPAPAGADLLKFQIAQPYNLVNDNVVKLRFTITTDNGQSPQPAGSAWYVAMKVPSGYKAVHMFWSPTSPTTPIFESYTPGANTSGGVDGRFVTPGTQKPAEATSNYVAPFNQVIIVVKASDLGLSPGDVISGFVSASTQSSDPANVGAGLTCVIDDMPDGLGFTGSYTVHDNSYADQTSFCGCKLDVPPTAVLTATPLSGNAPLTVNFDGSGSFRNPPPPGSIATYTLDFGDGTAPVTQASPMFSHTYNNPGEYPARLTATDPCGKTSTSAAQVVISVTNGVHLVSVVSRMQHDSITPPFEVNLPLTGTRGVECRSSATLGAGNYQMVFKFDNSLTSVTGASVTGAGSIASRQISPNNNHEYIVNLMGVADQQYLSVTLTGVAGAPSGGTVIGPQMGVLIGDVNASGRTDNGDGIVVRNLSGTIPFDTSSARADVNCSGRVDNGDAIVIRNNSGNFLSPSP
jgi:PKD domain